MKKQKFNPSKNKITNRVWINTVSILLIVISISVLGVRELSPSHAASAFLTRSGTSLMLNGSNYKFVGADAYGFSNGCDGHSYSSAEINAYFAALPPHSMTRFWAFNNANSNFDTIVAAAKAHNQLLMPVLSNSLPDCEASGQNFNKDANWYTSGYKTSLKPYAASFVAKYKNEPTIAVWEIQNEINDNGGNTVIKNFINDMAATIKANDPNHLVASGTWNEYNYGGSAAVQDLNSSPNIDLMDFHEYDYEYQNSKEIVSGHTSAMLQASHNLNIPLFVGETQANVGTAGSYAVQATADKSKFDQYLAMSGLDGVMIWDYSANNDGGDNFNSSTATFSMISAYRIAGITYGSVDTTPPTVAITAPPDNSAQNAGPITISATASDNLGATGLDHVDILLDSNTTPIKTFTGAGPYSFSWDASYAGNGSHTIKAVAYDTSGNSATATTTITLSGSGTLVTHNDTDFTYSSGWQISNDTPKYMGDDHYTNIAGSTATYSFTGTQIKIYGGEAQQYGYAAFSVDGGAETTLDLYAASRSDQVLIYTSPVLAAGTHTVTVRVTGSKDSSATDSVVSLDKFDVLTAPGAGTKLIGDINGDGHVNTLDLSILLTHDGTNYAPADLNHDGTVGAADLAILLSHWKW